MATSQTYVLNGPTQFTFPFGVRVASDLTLTLSTGGIVSSALYTVTGSGPSSTAVVITYPTAPTTGISLVATRRTPFTKVSTFSNDAAVSGSSLNAEFENVYRSVQDNDISLGFSAPVQWTPFTAYTALQSVVIATPAAGIHAGQTGLYVAAISHTSPAAFLEDANWTYIANLTSLIQAGLVVTMAVSVPYQPPALDDLAVLIAPNQMDISDVFVDLLEFRAFATVPATATRTFAVVQNTTQIATITFAAGVQQATILKFSTPPGGRFQFVAGDRLRIIGSSAADTTLAGIGILFRFRLVVV